MQQVQKQTEHKQDRAEVLIFLIYYRRFFPVFPRPVAVPMAKLLWTAGKLENHQGTKWEGRSFWLGSSILKAISLALKGERSITVEEHNTHAQQGCVLCSQRHIPSVPAHGWQSTPGQWAWLPWWSCGTPRDCASPCCRQWCHLAAEHPEVASFCGWKECWQKARKHVGACSAGIWPITGLFEIQAQAHRLPFFFFSSFFFLFLEVQIHREIPPWRSDT